MLLVGDVMFGPAAGIAVAAGTALAFVAVWVALPLRRRRQVAAIRTPPPRLTDPGG
jgi:hypothetical protein